MDTGRRVDAETWEALAKVKAEQEKSTKVLLNEMTVCRKCNVIKKVDDNCPNCGAGPYRKQKSSSAPLASRGQRFANMLLDFIFYFISYLILSFIFGIQNDSYIRNYVIGTIIMLLYYVPQEAFSGRTLGKLITGTKAVSHDGTALSFGLALGRTLCRAIPFDAFSFFGGKNGPRGWHDKIPKTIVISVKRTPQNEVHRDNQGSKTNGRQNV
jgi:uncharacterized RDD family membrane protein YckC